MNATIDTAVILAAGVGSRLGELTVDQPKAFLKVGNRTLIERSIQVLLSRGIKRIIIGTGYGSEYFDALRDTYPQVTTHKNLQFDNSGSMYTLYLMEALITRPFLLLEGDLLYESAALDFVVDDVHDNVILASDATHSGDEVFIQSNASHLLEGLNKQATHLDHTSGELVGICKLSLEAFALMLQFAKERYMRNAFYIDYEDALVGISSNINLYVKLVKDMAWCEIDNLAHLERAESIVNPKIVLRG